MEEKLIELVKQNPFLYDKRSNIYNINSDAKNKKWKEFAAKLHLPVNQIKKKWLMLKARYKMEKEKNCWKLQGPPNYTYTILKKEWKFFQLMRFMDDDTPKQNFMRFSNEGDDHNYCTSFNELFYGIDGSSNNTASCSNESFATESSDEDLKEELQKTQNDMSKILQLAKSSIKPSTSLELFFASLAASIEEAKLPPQVICRIKSKVLNIVHEVILKNNALTEVD